MYIRNHTLHSDKLKKKLSSIELYIIQKMPFSVVCVSSIKQRVTNERKMFANFHLVN